MQTITETTTSTTIVSSTNTAYVTIYGNASTSTETITSGTVTSYAACATNNLLGPGINQAGTYIANVRQLKTPTDQVTTSNSTSALDCCVMCQMSDKPCDLSYYDTAAKTCMMYKPKATNATCSHDLAAYFTKNRNTPNRFVVSNGLCGKVQDGAPAGSRVVRHKR